MCDSFTRHLVSRLAVAFAVFVALTPAQAQSDPPAPATGSTAFCLFELPTENDRRIWVNLGIVQYVDVRLDEIRIYYGGGNLGSGHEFRMNVKSPIEARALIDRMRRAAVACARG